MSQNYHQSVRNDQKFKLFLLLILITIAIINLKKTFKL